MRSLFNKLFIIIITLFMMSPNVYAQNCSYEDRARLNELAGKVTINYEIIEHEEEIEFESPDTGEILSRVKTDYSLKVSIYNITDELYVNETNDANDESKDILYSMTQNGVYSYNVDDFENIVKYTYRVRSAHKDCFDIGLNSFNFTKPKYNMYSHYGFCVGNENLPYCQRFITEDLNLSPPEVRYKVSEAIKEKETEEKKTSNEVLEFIKEYYIYFTGGTVIIAGVVVGYIIVRKRRVLWKS